MTTVLFISPLLIGNIRYCRTERYASHKREWRTVGVMFVSLMGTWVPEKKFLKKTGFKQPVHANPV